MTKPVRLLIGVVLAAVVVWLLFTEVFPWVDTWLNPPTMEASTSSDPA